MQSGFMQMRSSRNCDAGSFQYLLTYIGHKSETVGLVSAVHTTLSFLQKHSGLRILNFAKGCVAKLP